MTVHDHSQLRAYLDGELSPADSEALAQHLTACPRCRAELEAMRMHAEVAGRVLSTLSAPSIDPDPRAALARFNRASAGAVRSHPWETVKRSLDMARKSLISPRWRPVTVALTVVLTLAVLMSVAPVREAAADFLGLFRVRKFAVIPIDPAQAQRLEGLAQQAESVLGQPTILRAEGPRQDVSDAAEASERAGFRVRLPATLPDETTYATFNGRTSLQVQSGPAIHYEVQRSVLEALMQATGVSTAGLPQTETIGVTVDVGQGVAAEYRLDRGRISLFQTPSPSVDLPEGLDVVALSQTAFQFIGIPADEARRLATTIDWSSTLVLPLPTDMAQAQEVSIDGVTGLLVRSTDNSRNTNQETLLLWERDGIVYAMNGYGVESATLLSVAGSLQ